MIAVAEAERKVAITLQLVADQKNKSIAKQFEGQVIAAERGGTRAAEVESKKRVGIKRKEADSSAEILRKANKKQADEERKEREHNLREKAAADKRAEKEEQMRYRRIAKRLVKERKEKEREEKRAQDEFDKAREREREIREKRAGKLMVRDAKARERSLREEAAMTKRYHEKMTTDIKAAQKTEIESKRRASEAGLAAIQGGMDLVEGMANLGLVSEESFEKFEQSFQKVEAGFKALKGFTELVWKGREALIAMSAATKVQASANALLSGSNYRAAASQTVMNTTATGGVGSGVAAGIGAGGGAAGLGGLAVGGAAVAVAAAAGVGAFEIFQKLRREISGTTDESESLVGALMSWRKESQKAEESTERLERAYRDRTRREVELTDRQQVNARRYERVQSLRSSTALSSRSEFVLSGGYNDPLKSAGEQTSLAQADVLNAESELARVRRLNQEARRRGDDIDQESRVQAEEKLKEANENLLRIDQQRLQIMREQNKTAKDQIKALESQKDSKIAQFGNLSTNRQEQFRDLTERYKTVGIESLSALDIQRLKRGRFGGLGSGILREVQIARGRDAGGAVALANAGEFTELDQGIAKAQGIRQRTSPAAIKAAEDRVRADDARQKSQANITEVERERLFDVQRSKVAREKAKARQAEYEKNNPTVSKTGAIIDAFLGYRGDPITMLPTTFLDMILNPSPQRQEGNPFAPQQGARRPNPNQVAPGLRRNRPQQKVGEAADAVTKESVEVTRVTKTVLDAVLEGFRQIRKEIEEHAINEKAYK